MNYFSDFWNINDLIRVIVTFIYCFIRLDPFGLLPRWSESYLLIRAVQFGEPHVETEMILRNIQGANTTQVQW